MMLQNLINPQLMFSIENQMVVIEEKNNVDNKGLRDIRITDLPETCFAFSTDTSIPWECDAQKMAKARNQFLHAQSDYINKNCDAILVIFKPENKVDVLFMELKSGNPVPTEYERQLINAKLWLDYLVALFNTHPFSAEKIQIHHRKYILFSLNRKPQRVILGEKNMRPEMYHYQNEKIVRIQLSKTVHNVISYNQLLNVEGTFYL